MAITYPRSYPFSGKIFGPGSDLVIQRVDARNQDNAGAIEVMELGDPLWLLKIATKPSLTTTQRAAWEAWAASLQGGVQLFYGYHPIRFYPLAYGVGVLALVRAGGGAFDGTADLTGTSAFALTLGNLPAAYKATPGDMVSVALSNGNRMLHVATEAMTADGGGAGTLSVQPPVLAGSATGSGKVELVKARGLFVLKFETFTSPPTDPLGTVSFQAMQTVRPIA